MRENAAKRRAGVSPAELLGPNADPALAAAVTRGMQGQPQQPTQQNHCGAPDMHTQPPPYSTVVSQSAAANSSGQNTQPATGFSSAHEAQSWMGSQPGSAQPGSAQSGSAQPGSAEPGSAQPRSAQPGSSGQPSCPPQHDQTQYNTDVLSGNV